MDSSLLKFEYATCTNHHDALGGIKVCTYKLYWSTSVVKTVRCINN